MDASEKQACAAAFVEVLARALPAGISVAVYVVMNGLLLLRCCASPCRVIRSHAVLNCSTPVMMLLKTAVLGPVVLRWAGRWPLPRQIEEAAGPAAAPAARGDRGQQAGDAGRDLLARVLLPRALVVRAM
eukprot:CAMPEP_0179218096 /NCGR_PEP_ID=MMETSP0797-20121207/4280_1 /TAXON_ID=47934 /ORGANISM="Dinophysis acuminata, Strain DAEP01" /LENGTH=129 /DNA_ID=CAMNT_0020924399 /DNA_START=415 /DNA_END=802 /DNA_ORIENTATION=-